MHPELNTWHSARRLVAAWLRAEITVGYLLIIPFALICYMSHVIILLLIAGFAFQFRMKWLNGAYKAHRILPLTPNDLIRAAWLGDIPLFMGIYCGLYACMSLVTLALFGQSGFFDTQTSFSSLLASGLGVFSMRTSLAGLSSSDRSNSNASGFLSEYGCFFEFAAGILLPPVSVYYAIAGVWYAWLYLILASFYFGIRSFRLAVVVNDYEANLPETDEEDEDDSGSTPDLADGTASDAKRRRPETPSYELFALHPSFGTVLHHLRVGFNFSFVLTCLGAAALYWKNDPSKNFIAIFIPVLVAVLISSSVLETNESLRSLRLLPVTPRQCIFMISHALTLNFLGAIPPMLALCYVFPWGNMLFSVAIQAPLLFIAVLYYYSNINLLHLLPAILTILGTVLLFGAGYPLMSTTAESLSVLAAVCCLPGLVLTMIYSAPRGLLRNRIAYEILLKDLD